MAIFGLFDLFDVLNQNHKEKKVRELLRAEGFDENFIYFAVWAMGYMWLDEKHKKKACEKARRSREEVDAKVNFAFLVMLSQEDIANVLISNKGKAKQAQEEAIEALKKIKNEI